MIHQELVSTRRALELKVSVFYSSTQVWSKEERGRDLVFLISLPRSVPRREVESSESDRTGGPEENTVEGGGVRRQVK